MISPVHIQAILGSTRQGRFGETVAKWFMSVAEQRDDLTIELLDLRDWPLPFFNHPKAPTSGEIAPEAQKWAEKIDSADGYVFIRRNTTAAIQRCSRTPPTTSGTSGTTNRLASLATAACAARALQQIRQVAMELELAPVRVEVTPVSARRLFDERGNLTEERQSEGEPDARPGRHGPKRCSLCGARVACQGGKAAAPVSNRRVAFKQFAACR